MNLIDDDGPQKKKKMDHFSLPLFWLNGLEIRFFVFFFIEKLHHKFHLIIHFYCDDDDGEKINFFFTDFFNRFGQNLNQTSNLRH